MNVGEPLEVIRHRIVLVILSFKVERESTAGEIRRNLREGTHGAANASDKGTCKSWRSGE